MICERFKIFIKKSLYVCKTELLLIITIYYYYTSDIENWQKLQE